MHGKLCRVANRTALITSALLPAKYEATSSAVANGAACSFAVPDAILCVFALLLRQTTLWIITSVSSHQQHMHAVFFSHHFAVSCTLWSLLSFLSVLLSCRILQLLCNHSSMVTWELLLSLFYYIYILYEDLFVSWLCRFGLSAISLGTCYLLRHLLCIAVLSSWVVPLLRLLPSA